MEFPKRIFGVDTAKAYEEIMREEPKKDKKRKVEGRDNSDFIYVPSVDLYFAKDRSLLGKNWYSTHEELDKQGMKMPTIYEFKEFLSYLHENPNEEYTRIFNDITEVRSPLRAEWLDAKFDEKKIYFNHGIVNGELNAMNSETYDRETLMEDRETLMEDREPGIDLEYWLKNSTKQGLPKKNCNEGSLWYWHPRVGAVAWFRTDEDRACLNCDGYPSGSGSSLGVRAVKDGEPKNSGGKGE
jgi:hypothetical protein